MSQNKIRLQVTLTPPLSDKVKAARESGLSLSTIVESALVLYFEKQPISSRV